MASETITCHYEVLGIAQDAEASAIKKAYRKLAIKHHPDKGGNEQDFLRLQEAYECLSDLQERAWYDDHRDAILKGWSGNNNGATDEAMPDMLYDVVQYTHAGCYQGYSGDAEDGFYGVYRRVFAAVYDGELQGRPFDSNLKDELEGLSKDFGGPDAPWDQVTSFYRGWESFMSLLNFAWVDLYDVTEAPGRRVRRAMDEENRKARKTAKKARNSDILALVRFVKRRDPRVKARREAMDTEKEEKEQADKEAAVRRKKDAQVAREEWRQQAEEELAAMEEEDRLKGRVRLADLDDDYDYGGKKNKKKNKKGKKQQQEEEEAAVEINEIELSKDVEEEEIEDFYYEEESSEDESVPDVWRCECCKKDFQSEGQMGNHINSKKHKAAFKKFQAKMEKEPVDVEETVVGETNESDGADAAVEINGEEQTEDLAVVEELEGESSEAESEPDFWRCECCKKDFQSEGQVENHMKSKKHKAVFEKYQAKRAKREQEIMDEILDDQE